MTANETKSVEAPRRLSGLRALPILAEVIELAKEHDDLVEPDNVTQRIMLRCIGVGFSLGVAYNQTSIDNQWRERLNDAFKIVAKGGD